VIKTRIPTWTVLSVALLSSIIIFIAWRCANDLRYIIFGDRVVGTIEREIYDGSRPRAVVSYESNGVLYSKNSMRGAGFYNIGDKEVLFLFPDRPQNITEEFTVVSDFVALGVVVALLAFIIVISYVGVVIRNNPIG
jgi:hypothetical protein